MHFHNFHHMFYSFLPLIVIVLLAIIGVVIICILIRKERKILSVNSNNPEVGRIKKIQHDGKITETEADELLSSINNNSDLELKQKVNLNIHIKAVAVINILFPCLFLFFYLFFGFRSGQIMHYRGYMIFLLFDFVQIVTVYFFLKRKNWARILLIIFAFKMLITMHIIGIILGIYSLYVLFFVCKRYEF